MYWRSLRGCAGAIGVHRCLRCGAPSSGLADVREAARGLHGAHRTQCPSEHPLRVSFAQDKGHSRRRRDAHNRDCVDQQRLQVDVSRRDGAEVVQERVARRHAAQPVAGIAVLAFIIGALSRVCENDHRRHVGTLWLNVFEAEGIDGRHGARQGRSDQTSSCEPAIFRPIVLRGATGPQLANQANEAVQCRSGAAMMAV
eukprot:1249357-Prymnesium_polylepis.3